MPLFRRLLTRASEESLLLALLAGLLPLLWLMPEQTLSLPALVDWETLGALTGLMVLSRGLEESGYLARGGDWLLMRIHGERALAIALVLFAAALSTVITNDVALFIVVPLTVGLQQVAELPIGRLVIFEALAVNAGSTLSPIGNPQNLFLWQTSEAHFGEFALAMLPLAGGLLLVLLALVPLGFPAKRIAVAAATEGLPRNERLLWLSLALYPIFLGLTDFGWAVSAAVAIVALYGVFARRVLRGVDWLLLVVFILMFIDLGLLARLPALREMAAGIESLPGGMMTAGVLLSQLVSNVPATIFLEPFTDDWRLLAWGVSVGGFGVAIGSLANLIALRLARRPGIWKEFHQWSLPMLIAAYALALLLLQLRRP